MKKYAFVALLAVAMTLSYGVSTVLAQDSAEAKAPESVGVTITGVNYCLLSTLAKEEVADANATLAVFNALKVTEAKDIDDNVIADLVGKTLHYLPNKTGQPLLTSKDMNGKTVTIIGKLFKNESALLVESFESADGDDWDELPVGSMSGLQVL